MAAASPTPTAVPARPASSWAFSAEKAAFVFASENPGATTLPNAATCAPPSSASARPSPMPSVAMPLNVQFGVPSAFQAGESVPLSWSG